MDKEYPVTQFHSTGAYAPSEQLNAVFEEQPIEAAVHGQIWKLMPTEIKDVSSDEFCVRCLAYYHVNDGKLNPRVRKAVFVGFREGVKGFKLWDPEDKKIIISRDVTFDEAHMMRPQIPQQVEECQISGISQQVEDDVTLQTSDSSVSIKAPTKVTLGGDDLTDGQMQDTVDVGTQEQEWEDCIGYVDSCYARDLEKHRSTTGYVFTLAAAPVCWRCALQSTVTLSTTKAKYMALTEAMNEALWLQGLLDDLGIVQETIKVNCDSISTIYLAKNQVYHAGTKHVDVRFYFV
ncbi:uncharacterized protein LOC109846802 [Asparagus officinalis]|uniref:uncharacterized protein LOC109846802 n=1 Tax=Asparagus officinalis TaxID=4686 RepID=UPI00098DF21C|nr:uncharacterized protein LOC109846802 [Asparagus officinalis]